jgi:hypothetical protein
MLSMSILHNVGMSYVELEFGTTDGIPVSLGNTARLPNYKLEQHVSTEKNFFCYGAATQRGLWPLILEVF